MRSVTNFILLLLEYPITMKHLTLLEADPPLRLIKILSSEWEIVADLLGMSTERIEIIKADYHGRSIEFCCRKLMNQWLHDDDSPHYSRSWDGMCKLLIDMDHKVVANRLTHFFQL